MMPDQNPIYDFMKSNKLTDLDEKTFLNKYSAPEKAKEVHSFFVENNLTDLDSANFYDKYLKKKDQVSPSVSSPTKSQSVLPDFEKGRAFAEKGFLMQGEGTKTPKPEKRISFEPSFNIAAPFKVKVLEEGEEPSLASDLMIAGARGQIQGKVANLLPAGKVPTNEELGEIAQLQTDAKLLPQSKAEKAYQEKGLKGLFTENPLLGAQFVGETMLSSLASLAQASSRTLPTAIAAGAGAGAAFGGIGALPGAAMGMLAGQSAAGYNLSTSQDILNSLSENGVDISNKESLIKAFSDENKMAKIRTTAAKYGVPILLFDAATAGLAGKLATGAMGKSLSRKLLAGLGEAGIQMTGGAGGELAGQIASGKKVNWDDVAVEAIAEVPGGAVEVATGIALERSKASSNNNTLATQIATQGPEDGTKDAVLNLNRDLANNVITPEQHQEGMNFVEKAVQVSSKIPETVTGESKAKSIELLVERNDIKENNQILEQQKQATDEAYHAGIDEEIKANEEKIKKIDSEVYNIAKNPIKEKPFVQISEQEVVEPQPKEVPTAEEVKPTEVDKSEAERELEKGKLNLENNEKRNPNANHPFFNVGQKWDEGNNADVRDFKDERKDKTKDGVEVITKVNKPATVDSQGKMTSLAEVEVTIFDSIEQAKEFIDNQYNKYKTLAEERISKAETQLASEVKPTEVKVTEEVKPTEEDIKSFVDKWEGFDLLNKADEDFYNKNEKAIEKEISDRKEKRKPKPILDESGNFKANWNYEGEGDLLSGYTGKKAYVERMLGDNYIRAKQQNKLNTEEPLSYGLYEGKDGVLAMDANYNTIGRLDINNKGGIEHIVVAPEFERKGVAQKMIKELQKAGIKINFEKSERISPDAAKLFNKIAKSEVKPTEVKEEPLKENEYYHATDATEILAPSDKGYKKREGANVVGEGIYFGKDKEHLTDRFGKNAIKAELDIKNPLITDNVYVIVDGREIDMRSLSKEDIDFLKGKGYDAIKYVSADRAYSNWDETVVFDKSQIKVKEEVKPTEVKVTEEVKPAEVKQITPELKEGEVVKFKTPQGNTLEGEKVEIPGYEDMDMVLVKDGFENRIYELTSGIEIGNTGSAFSKQDAVSALRNQLLEKNVSSGKIKNKLFKEKSLQINPSNKFESYAQERTARERADYESLPLKYTPDEIKKLTELKNKAIDLGIDKRAKELEDAISSRAKEGTYKGGVEFFEKMLQKDIDQKIKKEAEDKKVPYPEEFIKKYPKVTEEYLKAMVNEGYKVDKFAKIPVDIKESMINGLQLNRDFVNKYGYAPYEQSDIFFTKLLYFMNSLGARENKAERMDIGKKELMSALDDLIKVHENEFGKKTEEESEVKVYNAKDLKANPKVLEKDENYNTLTYPKSFVRLSTNMRALKSSGFENAKIGDVINIFKKDYVIDGFLENKKNPNETKVLMIRVDKDGNLLREQNLSKKEQEEGRAKEFEEEEFEEGIEEIESNKVTQDDLKKAEAKFATAKDRFEKAKAKVEASQVTQRGMFGGEQKGMFAMGGEEAKSTLDPLRIATKEAKAELDDIRNRIKVQEEAQQELKPVEEAPKKTYQEALKEKQEAEKKRNREVGAEKAAITKELKKEANKIEISDARSAALNYLSGANLSEEAINEVSGRVKRARLNTGEREFKSEEARARDYVAKKGEGESLDAAAHSIWDNLSDEMQSKMDTQEVKEALMQAIMENKTKAEALKSLIDGYKEESLEDQEAEFYRRYNITEDEIEAELALAEESLELDGSDEYDFDLPEEHINNLIEQYEAEAKNKIEQPAEGGKEKGAEKISAREVSESETKLAEEFKDAVKKAGKKARENARNEFVNRNFNLIKEKLKIEIKCPT